MVKILIFLDLVFAKYVMQAHVLGFGILVVLVILFLPNGIVGDWKRLFRKEVT